MYVTSRAVPKKPVDPPTCPTQTDPTQFMWTQFMWVYYWDKSGWVG